MNRWLKFGVSAIFGFSAIMKLIDFEDSVIYLANITSIASEHVRYGLTFLIFLEMLIAFTLPINWPGQRIVQNSALFLLTLFLGLSARMAFTGVSNCGCFGTNLVSHPWLTVVKNLVLIVIVVILRYDFGAQKYA